MDTEVLVVGAGPTGLVLALWLARLGIQVRIIDKTAGPGSTSRALAVQARTLEFYRQLGFADELVEAGLVFSAANLWARGRRAAHVELGRLGAGKSPFPYGLIYPQDEHERFLIERLKELDVPVERMTELIDFEEVDGRIVARLQDSTCETECLAGCDGARSTVREKLGISFPGGTYEHLFYVADVDASGPLMDRELHVSIDESDFAAVFPLKGEGRVRLIGTIRPGAEKEGEHLGWEDVGKNVLQRLRIDVRRVNWFSTYHVHHRVAARFRQGRAFLLGDAAHIHSPVGGQGMNTGIGDAVNLAWKLAAGLRAREASAAEIGCPGCGPSPTTSRLCSRSTGKCKSTARRRASWLPAAHRADCGCTSFPGAGARRARGSPSTRATSCDPTATWRSPIRCRAPRVSSAISTLAGSASSRRQAGPVRPCILGCE